MRIPIFFFILLFLNTGNAFAQFGKLDNSFSEDGKLVSDFNASTGQCVAVLKNGKILVGGSYAYYYHYENDFLLTKYNNDGSIDEKFGNNGRVTTNIRGNQDVARDIAIQKDGKILLAGQASLDNQTEQDINFAVVRYTQNGILDLDFGHNGQILDQRFTGYGRSILLTEENKILVGGYSYKKVYDPDDDVYNYSYQLCLVKYNSDGTNDSSFGNLGKVTIDFGDSMRISAPNRNIQVQQDGKILIAGTLTSRDFATSKIIIARVSQSGIIDSSFGVNGFVITEAGQGSLGLTSMLLQDDQKIVVTGGNSSDSIFTIRLKQNGKIDSSFGRYGKIAIAYNNLRSYAKSSLLLPTGEILIAGGIDNDSSFLLMSLKNNGILDSSFGINGFTVTSFIHNNVSLGDGWPVAYDIALSSDGKIVIVGTFSNEDEEWEEIALARYNGQTVLPITLPSFTATKKQSSVLLNWQTASESNNSYFIIERSNNNSNFKELGKVNSKGNSTQVQQYNFEDNVPVDGANYYRLKQVNKDGTATISKTVLVDFSKAAIIKLYPNPVKNVITIEGLTGNKTTISIIDLNGRVLTTTSTNDQTYTWNIKALPQGTYYLRTEADKNVNTVKFIKE